MTLAEQLTSDLTVFFNDDDFTESVTYAGTENIPAIVSYEEEGDEDAGSVRTRATLYVKASDVSDPAYRDAVVIGSNTWRVMQVINGDGYVWKLALERDERPVI